VVVLVVAGRSWWKEEGAGRTEKEEGVHPVVMAASQCTDYYVVVLLIVRMA